MSNKKGGLLDALMNDRVAQSGGADSYRWHRDNARQHLQNIKQLPWEAAPATGERKRQAWIDEVSRIQTARNISWREALQEASRQRKLNIGGYKTIVERTTEGYTGRSASTVKCDKCPGKYDKDVVRSSDTGDVVYRPNAHKAPRRHLSAEAAKNILRKYYRSRADQTKQGLESATRSMRLDISKKKGSLQTPCPTRLITVNKSDGTSYQRNVVDRSHPDFAECRSNWLYRDNPSKFDMQKIDHGEGKQSPAYGRRRLYKKKVN